jgi:flagellar biosynthesis/type III secretory pathway chaperone
LTLKAKVACVIYAYGEKYNIIAKNAANSFKKYHPDVDLFFLNKETIKKYLYKQTLNYDDTILPYVVSHFLISNMGYDKVIKIGADTITCGRLNGFLEDLKEPKEQRKTLLATLDYFSIQSFPYIIDESKQDIFSKDNFFMCPTKTIIYKKFLPEDIKNYCHNLPETFSPHDLYEDSERGAHTLLWASNEIRKLFTDSEYYQEQYEKKTIPIDVLYLNSDVVCFNDNQGLSKIIKIFLILKEMYESDDNLAKLYLSKNFMYEELSEERIKKVIKLAKQYDKNLEAGWALTGHFLAEQQALNIFFDCYCSSQLDTVGVVDLTNDTNSSYNVRVYGTQTPVGKTNNLKNFYIKDNKMYNHVGREVKVFHYCDGFTKYKKIDSSLKLKDHLDTVYHSKFPDKVNQFLIEECQCEQIL